jgi:EF hand
MPDGSKFHTSGSFIASPRALFQQEDSMNRKTAMALAVAAAFMVPMAYAAGDKAKDASAGTSASQGASGNTAAEAMFKQMDKNNDGMVTREEAAGTPHEKDFAKLDKNNDGKLSRDEHAAAPEHGGNKAATGGTNEPNTGSRSTTDGPTRSPEGKTK